ncbi:hypothetical protein ACIP1T_26235 [Pseudomonas japonica]|uniref:hypothetical protein n=1 Tax=Pseudomonas japonica TaxID=256466 RepID=UPI0037F1E96E
MFDYFLALLMINLCACLIVAIYWGYRRADAFLAHLPNCTTLNQLAMSFRGGGIRERLHLIGSIAMTVTWPRFMSLSDIVSFEDIEKFPRMEKIQLAIFLWFMMSTLVLMICAWTGSTLAEYFCNR